jgi:hypothetical protein
LYLLFFAVVYSHTIFFSSRWDAWAPRYQEVWFLTTTALCIVPVLIRYGIGGFSLFWARIILHFIRLIIQICLAIILILWWISAALDWSIYNPELFYTSIGYIFAENRALFHGALYSSGALLVCLIFDRDFENKEKSQSIMGILFGIGITAIIFCLLIENIGVLGLYGIFGATLGMLFGDAGVQISKILIARENNSDRKEKMEKGRSIRVSLATFAMYIILAVMYWGVEPKGWAGMILILAVLFPFLEIFLVLGNIIIHKFNPKIRLPHSYGLTAIAAFSGLVFLFLLIVPMVGTANYRYMINSFLWILGGILLGLVIASLLLSKARNWVILGSFLGSILLPGLLIGVWTEFRIALAHSDPNFIPDIRNLPYLGPLFALSCGLVLGFLLTIRVHFIEQDPPFNSKTHIFWEGNRVLWSVVTVPLFFFMGYQAFDTRIYEWNRDYVMKNLTDSITFLGAVAGVFAIITIIIFLGLLYNSIREKNLKNREENAIPGDINHDRKNRITARTAPALFLAVIVMGSLLSVVGIIALSPAIEPSYHIKHVGNEDYTVWSTFAAEKVRPDYRPGIFSTQQPQITIDMVCGETERAHLIFSTNRMCDRLVVNISSLIRWEGDIATADFFPKTGINWYFVTYNFDGQEEHLIPGNPTQYRGRENITEAYLSQLAAWGVAAKTNQPLWFSFTSQYDTKPGTYRGEIQLSTQYGSTIENSTIPVEVVIHNYQKPLKYRLGTFFGSSGSLGRTLWRHQRMGYHPSYDYMIPPSFVSNINWSTGEYLLNWTGFDAALNACAREGYTHLIYNWYPTDQTGMNNNISEAIPRYSAKWNQTVLAILTDASAHLNSTSFDLPYGQGLIRAIDMVYMELYDEPGKDDAWRITQYGQLLDQAAPEWRLICTMGISREALTYPNWTGSGGVFDVVDVRIEPSGCAREYEAFPEIRAAYAEYPAELWFYDINAPWPPYPNSAQAYNPGVNIYSHVLRMVVLMNVSGYLFWTAGDTTWADGGDGYAGWGSGRYFYPVEDGSGNWDPGYRFEVMDEGMEVAEMLRHINALLSGLEGPLTEQEKSEAQEIVNRYTTLYPSYTQFPSSMDLEELYAARLTMINLLSNLN